MIQLYWKNAASKVVGSAHGIAPADLSGIDPVIRQAHAAVRSQVADGKLGYAALPDRRQYVDAVKSLVERYRDNTRDMMNQALTPNPAEYTSVIDANSTPSRASHEKHMSSTRRSPVTRNSPYSCGQSGLVWMVETS